MRTTLVRWMATLITAVVVALGVFAGSASAATPVPADVPPFPAGDCVEMAGATLSAIGLSAGAPLIATGAGAAWMNAGAVVGYLTMFKPVANCSNYWAYATAAAVCKASNGWKWNPKTAIAKFLVRKATNGKRETC